MCCGPSEHALSACSALREPSGAPPCAPMHACAAHRVIGTTSCAGQHDPQQLERQPVAFGNDQHVLNHAARHLDRARVRAQLRAFSGGESRSARDIPWTLHGGTMVRCAHRLTHQQRELEEAFHNLRAADRIEARGYIQPPDACSARMLSGRRAHIAAAKRVRHTIEAHLACCCQGLRSARC